MSVLGGLMLTLAWYGGYLLLLLFVPIAILAVVVLPREKRLKRGAAPAAGKQPRKGLPALVFYYTAVMFLFTLLYSAAASNLSTHLAQSNLGTAATAGVAMALLLAGGVVSGTFFSKLSARLDDYMIPLAFLILFAGYTFLNLFAGSLLLTMIATFVAGTASCLCQPQCVFSVSRLVDTTNSAQASTLIASVAPGFGVFLSPVIITPVTLWLGGVSTRFRFQFVGLAALLFAAVFFAVTRRRSRKNQGLSRSAQ
jgi:predicted MFS family arabinose efflux permease